MRIPYDGIAETLVICIQFLKWMRNLLTQILPETQRDTIIIEPNLPASLV